MNENKKMRRGNKFLLGLCIVDSVTRAIVRPAHQSIKHHHQAHQKASKHIRNVIMTEMTKSSKPYGCRRAQAQKQSNHDVSLIA
jgi:hypothetical protein